VPPEKVLCRSANEYLLSNTRAKHGMEKPLACKKGVNNGLIKFCLKFVDLEKQPNNSDISEYYSV
jgi:hypothetical protein